MVYATVFNTRRQPVEVGGGRTVGGGEWGTVVTTDPEAKTLLDEGALVLVRDVPAGGDVNPDAAAAYDRTQLLIKREEAAAALEKPQLQSLAKKRGEDPGDAGVDELRRALVERLDLDIPTTKKKQTGGGGNASSDNQEAK